MPAKKRSKKTKPTTPMPVVEELVADSELAPEVNISQGPILSDEETVAEGSDLKNENDLKTATDEEKVDKAITHEERAREAINGLTSLQRKEKKSINLKLMFFTTVFTALIVALVAGGVYVYITGLANLSNGQQAPVAEETVVAPSPTPEATASPSATPVVNETVDVSVFKVSVLNGSGKIGEAGKAQRLLEDGGFEVSNVSNASRYDFKETVIQVKENVPDSAVKKAKSLLSGTYSLTDGSTLPANNAYDIVITVGSE